MSEVPTAKVDTLIRASKLAQEARRNAEQVLTFHAQNNRPKKGSTVGVVDALTPSAMLSGERMPMNVVSRRSTKTPKKEFWLERLRGPGDYH